MKAEASWLHFLANGRMQSKARGHDLLVDSPFSRPSLRSVIPRRIKRPKTSNFRVDVTGG